MKLYHEGRTHHLGRSKRPSEDARSALNRLAARGLVVKVVRGTYEIARAKAGAEAA